MLEVIQKEFIYISPSTHILALLFRKYNNKYHIIINILFASGVGWKISLYRLLEIRMQGKR